MFQILRGGNSALRANSASSSANKPVFLFIYDIIRDKTYFRYWVVFIATCLLLCGTSFWAVICRRIVLLSEICFRSVHSPDIILIILKLGNFLNYHL